MLICCREVRWSKLGGVEGWLIGEEDGIEQIWTCDRDCGWGARKLISDKEFSTDTTAVDVGTLYRLIDYLSIFQLSSPIVSRARERVSDSAPPTLTNPGIRRVRPSLGAIIVLPGRTPPFFPGKVRAEKAILTSGLHCKNAQTIIL